MDKQRIDELRDYYDNTSTADDMDGGTWETDVDPNPMVTTSLRLPKDVLDWVREQAAEQHTKPTSLIRHWIEQRRELADNVHRFHTAALHTVAGKWVMFNGLVGGKLYGPIAEGTPDHPGPVDLVDRESGRRLGIEERLERLEHAVFEDVLATPRSPSE